MALSSDKVGSPGRLGAMPCCGGRHVRVPVATRMPRDAVASQSREPGDETLPSGGTIRPFALAAVTAGYRRRDLLHDEVLRRVQISQDLPRNERLGSLFDSSAPLFGRPRVGDTLPGYANGFQDGYQISIKFDKTRREGVSARLRGHAETGVSSGLG